ncbi:hypothetical protein P171DRAFT_15173 [Karstenula rhodostoma CBS 690.94]|uniref:Uncharacterized protein n=1 Tax=Karstenula rhodostoma CBS 690.94 TaxID=1392251 RepID=A0A9P4PZ20_9PLEO|nr:hypothetical protein P171DRAFT_15173 [Karstenula rhodostoma CBS 690.94]
MVRRFAARFSVLYNAPFAPAGIAFLDVLGEWRLAHYGFKVIADYVKIVLIRSCVASLGRSPRCSSRNTQSAAVTIMFTNDPDFVLTGRVWTVRQLVKPWIRPWTTCLVTYTVCAGQAAPGGQLQGHLSQTVR